MVANWESPIEEGEIERKVLLATDVAAAEVAIEIKDEITNVALHEVKPHSILSLSILLTTFQSEIAPQEEKDLAAEVAVAAEVS